MTLKNKKNNPARHILNLRSDIKIGEVYRGEETKRKDLIFIMMLDTNVGEWVTCDNTTENQSALMAASKTLQNIRNTIEDEQNSNNRGRYLPRRTDEAFVS